MSQEFKKKTYIYIKTDSKWMLQKCSQIHLEKKFLLPKTTNLSSHLQLLQEKTAETLSFHTTAYLLIEFLAIETKKKSFYIKTESKWMTQNCSQLLQGKTMRLYQFTRRRIYYGNFGLFKGKQEHFASIHVWNWYFWKK